MNENENEHFLTLEDFKAKYADAREATLFNKVVLGSQKPPGNNLLDDLLQKVQTFTKMLDASKINEINRRLTILEEKAGDT